LSLQIDFSDFESLKLNIILKNATSGTDFLAFSDITIEELMPEGIKFSLPKVVAAQGHSVVIIFLKKEITKLPKKELPSDGNIPQAESVAIGKVVGMEREGQSCTYEVKFNQFDTNAWKEINETFNKRQQEILNLFEKIKFESKR
jgi:hypothetical protein